MSYLRDSPQQESEAPDRAEPPTPGPKAARLSQKTASGLLKTP